MRQNTLAGIVSLCASTSPAIVLMSIGRRPHAVEDLDSGIAGFGYVPANARRPISVIVSRGIPRVRPPS
jgi:hypothetical protein